MLLFFVLSIGNYIDDDYFSCFFCFVVLNEEEEEKQLNSQLLAFHSYYGLTVIGCERIGK